MSADYAMLCPSVRARLTDGLDGLPPVDPPAPGPDAGYGRVCLRRDDRVELVAARWKAGGASALHGHGDSAAAYRVVSGAVEDERFLPDNGVFRRETVVIRAGETSYLPPGAYHRVRALADAVTVHAYSPPPADAVAPAPACAGLDEVRGRHLDAWADREAAANKEGATRMPAGTLAEMRTCGVLAAPVPADLGGWGATLADSAEFVRQVARRAPSTALALVMPLGNAATCRIPADAVPPGSRAALGEGKRWMADQVRRGRILAVANSEPGAGGDLANTKTAARRGPDGTWRLTGRKSFATFGRDADAYLCAARRAGGSGEKAEVIDGFFVPRSAAGLAVDDRWDPAGMRPTASCGLDLDGAAAEAVMGYPGCLEGVNARHWSTVLFAAVFVGTGEGALREGVRQAGDGQWAKATLAEAALALDAAAGFVEAVAALDAFPLPKEAGERARRAKTFAARSGVDAAARAAMVSGGRSYSTDSPVFRFLCDALAGPLLRPPMPQAMDAIIAQLAADAPARARAA